ncbi:MAG: ethanolamine ammonia-lyase subunit EutC [Acidobacteriota bacterium]|nr:ethanolamine ammonia-lyase subunit EutC [Acidobacteriota bacterium]MDQ2840919.1 ethanolamine ammonia-lyase subunit EutC [Acidobacteriota bacterium]
MTALRDWTTARVGLGLAGHACPTREMLDLRLAQARARDAVHAPLDVVSLTANLAQNGRPSQRLHSQARDRAEYLRRPDLGRILSEPSRETVATYAGSRLAALAQPVFIVVDGLSALAVERHAPALLKAVFGEEQRPPDESRPLWIVEQGRVAIGDAIGESLGAAMTVVLIGERPGLSSPDSLGLYLTWAPRSGRTDAERNCISNIHEQGLSYYSAAHKLLFLMREAQRRELSGGSSAAFS